MKNHKKMRKKVVDGTKEIEKQIGIDDKKDMNGKIEKIKKEQIKEMGSW